MLSDSETLHLSAMMSLYLQHRLRQQDRQHELKSAEIELQKLEIQAKYSRRRPRHQAVSVTVPVPVEGSMTQRGVLKTLKAGLEVEENEPAM